MFGLCIILGLVQFNCARRRVQRKSRGKWGKCLQQERGKGEIKKTAEGEIGEEFADLLFFQLYSAMG